MNILLKRLKSLLPGIAAAVTYGMNPLFTLPLYQEGFSADAVLLCRYFPAVVMLGVLMVLNKESFSVSLKQLGALAGCGLLFGLSSLTLFLSYKTMDAGIASTLLFVYPVMTAVLMTCVFKEKMRFSTCVSMGLSICGIALLLRTADGAILSGTGIILTMVSALTFALYLIAMGRPVFKGLSARKICFFVLFSGSLLFAGRLFAGCGKFGVFSLKALFFMTLLALLPTMLSLTCTFISVKKVGSTVTAILGSLEPLTAVFFGVLVFHESFSLRIALGIVLILSSVVLIALCAPSRK